MFDWLPFPALLVTRECAFIHANADGARLLEAGDPLVLVDGYLGLTAGAQRQHLPRAFSDLNSETGVAIALPRGAYDFPLLVSVRSVDVETVARNGIALPKGHAPADSLVLMLALNDGGAAMLIAERRALTDTEAGVLRALLAGETVRRVAQKRQVSINTVQSQVRHILAKLGLESLNQVVLWARAWQ